MSEPKCPSCKVDGVESIATKPSKQMLQPVDVPAFRVVYCRNCGHVYGIIPNMQNVTVTNVASFETAISRLFFP